MTLSLAQLGLKGRYLASHGIRLKVTPRTHGGTACYLWDHAEVRVSPLAAWRLQHRPNSAEGQRLRLYVVEHELWHGCHHMLLDYDTKALRAARGLSIMAAAECVADGACLVNSGNGSTLTFRMLAWVTTSVQWHSKVMGSKYTLTDCRSPEALGIVARIAGKLAAWGTQNPVQP